ncbi:hypothetical protein BT69DRAFT_1221536 [Atractiella rhizophila]|nr:hypothetical protein BT69DRAFT_1221536 [Atractiella rhizophila]
MFTETLPILLLSLVGLVFSGELLNRLANWRVFVQIEELFILVPILQNLKGNLEMVLAARFSTSANIGELDVRRTRQALLMGNLTLLQVQALIVSFLSGVIAFILGLASRNGIKHHLQHPNYKGGDLEGVRGGYFEGVMVLCASMLAAGLSSAILGSFMCGLVILCRWKKINPDNVATPVAGALGDLITLTILGIVASSFLHFMGTIISTFVFILLVGWIALNFVLTWKNAYTQELLGSGWSPLLGAMIVSSGTGFVLERYANRFEGFPLFSLVVTGLCGNLGAIFVSRFTTSLHSSKPEPLVPLAIILFTIGWVILALFYFFALFTNQLSLSSISLPFFLLYVGSNAVSLAFTFTFGSVLTNLFWKFGYDPDMYALPILTSVVDCAAQGVLVLVFKVAAEEIGAEPVEMVERTMRFFGRWR